MSMKCKNNLDEETMKVTVSLTLRTRADQELIKIKWPEVEKFVKENYKPPSTHTLGQCKNWKNVASNEQQSSCVVEWIFDLLPKKTKTTRKK